MSPLLLLPSLVLAPGCSPSLSALEGELDAASSPLEIAEAVRALVLGKGERGARVVEAFDARRPDCAFDPELSILVLFDPEVGGLHHEQVARTQVHADTGSAGLDAAVAEAVPYHWSSVHFGIPAEEFRELVQLERPQGPLFVALQAGASKLHGLACLVEGGRLASWSYYDVDPETLQPIQRDQER